MKKIIALAALTLAVSACDPYASEPGGTPTVNFVWVGGVEDNTAPFAVADPTLTAGGGYVIIVKANVLLDGASIEATPQSCTPADGWLAVSGTGATATATAGNVWYTCYYPSTASDSEPGASIWIFAAPPASDLTAAGPFELGVLEAGDYSFTGSVAAHGGAALDVSFTLTVVP
jgi:hypothetical protein